MASSHEVSGVSLVSSSSVDDLAELRLPPRFSEFPAPFDFPEKPVPEVSEVSLILESPAKMRSPPPLLENGQKKQGLDKYRNEVVGVSKELQAQRVAITRMEAKLDKIMQFQDEFMSQIFRRGALISHQAQTDEEQSPRRTYFTPVVEPPQNSVNPFLHNCRYMNENLRRSAEPQQGRFLTHQPGKEESFFSESSQRQRSLHFEEFHDDSFSGSCGGGSISSPVLKKKYFCQPVNSPSSGDEDDDEDENSDPPLSKNSSHGFKVLLTSPNRVIDGRPPLNLRQYVSPDIPLRSPENVRPTNHHSPKYRTEDDVDQRANEYLENAGVRNYCPHSEEVRNSKATGMFPTDTTVYGMTPSNLSFATKDYLQRYGLVHPVHGPKNVPPSCPCMTKSPQEATTPRLRGKDRILNVTAIRNQPKLL